MVAAARTIARGAAGNSFMSNSYFWMQMDRLFDRVSGVGENVTYHIANRHGKAEWRALPVRDLVRIVADA